MEIPNPLYKGFLVLFQTLCIMEVPTKKWENTKKYIYKKYLEEIQKIIGARKGCWNAEKIPKLVEEIQKCIRLKFDSESPVHKKNSILRKKSSKSDVYGLN
jgi:hypothetical protein